MRMVRVRWWGGWLDFRNRTSDLGPRTSAHPPLLDAQVCRLTIAGRRSGAEVWSL